MAFPFGSRARPRLGRADGFTLIEVLVVILLLGLLAAIAVPQFLGQREQAYLATVKSDLRNYADRQAKYLIEHEVYGSTEDLASYGDPVVVSPGNKVEVVAGGGGTTGVCLMAMHQPTRLVWFYDSSAGGLMAKGQSCVPCQGNGGGGADSGPGGFCPGSNGDGHYQDCGSGTVCTNPPRAGQSGGAHEDNGGGPGGGNGNGGGNGRGNGG